ncbi:Disease resistance RPP13-like protein 4 [Carex littledalei]|uniref:Disease resistance RPP13-like protein 4 n=1 Tax=Carex littledalei TaxID=544730 RepID=A0A833R1Q2_9POAL|nr:Disease resistance RPP13-like protein 4 [Carex littledalei]
MGCLEEPKRKLVELILKKHVELTDDPWYGKVISVVGMGGLGKTTLVKEVYDCQELRNEFNQGRIFWGIVQHPFNKEEFIESLAKQIPSNFRQVDDEGGAMEKKSKEYLKDKKYLIVLDDLSSLTEWEEIKKVLPTGNESRIIVTTRYRSPLAESISQPSDIYEIKELSKTDAVDLFYKAVYKTPNYRFISECSSIRKGGVEVYGYVSRDREFVRNIEEQLKKLPKEPVLKVHF